MNKFPLEKFTKKDDEFCIVTGVIGAALGITCLIQHLYLMNFLWFTWLMVAVYVFAITAFVLLAKKNRVAPVLMVITSGLLLIDELFIWLTLTFSLAVLLLLLYSFVIAVLLYVEGFPKKLNALAIASKEDEDYWKDKL